MRTMWAGWWGAAVSLALLLGAAPATAQDAETPADERNQPADDEAAPVDLDAFKVVGSRLPGRSAADSPVPVDVIEADSFRHYGVRDMNSLLAATVPSYNVSQHAIGDVNALVRPAKLRGLPPDSTLVLVNGKRRHRSSAISFFTFGVANGSHGADVSTIPSIALERVEVLRDGAAAQYGSDAVAGVLNFVLRDAPEGGTLEARWGQHYHGDGDLVSTAANLGLPLTDAGFANLSFEFTNSDSTNRSVQRSDALDLIRNGNDHVRRSPVQAWGAPDVKYDYKFFGNVGLDLGDAHHAYAFGNWAEREIADSWYWRSPVSRPGVFTTAWGGADNAMLIADLSPDGRSGNCPTILASDYAQRGPAALAPLQGKNDCHALAQTFPGGFTPRLRAKAEDWSLAFGLRGEWRSAAALLDGWHYDASAVFGRHRGSYSFWNNVNPQLVRLGADIPTRAFVRAYTERDKTFNLDLSRPFDVGLFASPLNVAFGLEYREEEFEIEAGEPRAWCIDDAGECGAGRPPHGLAQQGFGIGTTGYPGIRPEETSKADRGSFGAYLDLEADAVEQVLVNAAGRFEHHEGIGESLDGKLAARWNLWRDVLALRGSIGTGFRAPTVGQASYRDTTTILGDDGNLVESSILPTDDPIARHKGAKPLSPETSVSFSLGTVLTLGALSVTLDYYNIELRNRIGLGEDLAITPEDVAALAARGVDASRVSNVQFFANAFETYTQGIDLVATYPVSLLGGRLGRTVWTFAGNWNDTKINLDSIDTNVIGSLRKHQLEELEPEFRFSLTADHTWGPWRLLSRLHYYDDFTERHQNIDSQPIYAHARALVDLEASYTFFDLGVTLAAGAQNLFDTYPTRNKYARAYGQKYPNTSPYGYNGGFYYLRAGFEWG